MYISGNDIKALLCDKPECCDNTRGKVQSGVTITCMTCVHRPNLTALHDIQRPLKIYLLGYHKYFLYEEALICNLRFCFKKFPAMYIYKLKLLKEGRRLNLLECQSARNQLSMTEKSNKALRLFSLLLKP